MEARRQISLARGNNFSCISHDIQETVRLCILSSRHATRSSLLRFTFKTFHWRYRLLSLNGGADAHCFCFCRSWCHMPRSIMPVWATSFDVTNVAATIATQLASVVLERDFSVSVYIQARALRFVESRAPENRTVYFKSGS